MQPAGGNNLKLEGRVGKFKFVVEGEDVDAGKIAESACAETELAVSIGYDNDGSIAWSKSQSYPGQVQMLNKAARR